MSEDTQFKPKRKKTGGRKPGSKNKVTQFKYFVEEMERRGVDLYQMWLDALARNDDKIANAISKAFPHVSQRPTQDVKLDSDVDNLVIVVSGTEAKADGKTSRASRVSKPSVPKP